MEKVCLLREEESTFTRSESISLVPASCLSFLNGAGFLVVQLLSNNAMVWFLVGELVVKSAQLGRSKSLLVGGLVELSSSSFVVVKLTTDQKVIQFLFSLSPVRSRISTPVFYKCYFSPRFSLSGFFQRFGDTKFYVLMTKLGLNFYLCMNFIFIFFQIDFIFLILVSLPVEIFYPYKYFLLLPTNEMRQIILLQKSNTSLTLPPVLGRMRQILYAEMRQMNIQRRYWTCFTVLY